jgi:glutamate--cysteine ligase
MSPPPRRLALIQDLYDACKSPDRFCVGMEWEKEIVRGAGSRLRFDEPGGIESLLQSLVDHFAWRPIYEGPHLIALERDGESVTIEPGAQVEWSSRPERGIAELERNARRHLAELQFVTWGDDRRILSIAYPAWEDVATIPFVPKSRYRIMEKYLPTRGRLAHGMMKGTTSVQAALDFASEQDCGRKIQAALGVGPLVTALFANSPLVAGAPAGETSYRARCWLETDPDRTGFLSQVLKGGFTFARYVEWLLDVPMMFWKVDGRYEAAPPIPFRKWLQDGVEGRFPSMGDWRLHMNSVFPEVRLQRYLEIRGADNTPFPFVLALPALWKGLLYDDGALDRALELAGAIPPGRRADLYTQAARHGLAATWDGKPLAAWALRIVEVAEAGLRRQGETGYRETAYLAPLFEAAQQGQSPGARVLQRFHVSSQKELMEALTYAPVAEIPLVDPAAG